MATPCPIQLIYGPTAHVPNPNPIVNAIVPLTGHYRLTSKIVYSDDEQQYMYTEYTLMFDLVVYPQISTGFADIEAEVARLRTILSVPNYRMRIYPLGLGQFGTINWDQYDVKGGPFPQDIEVEPFTGNRSISVRGSIMFRLAPCITHETVPGTDPLPTRFLQYSVEQDINVNEDGLVEMTFHFTAQYVNRLGDAAGGPINRAALNNIASPLIRQVGKSFQGMKKKIRTSVSRDGRIYHCKVVYTEHESDSAFHPYTRHVSLVDDLESSLLGEGKGKGFYNWRRSLDCSIKLPHRIHKGWAWYVFKRIVQERFKKLKLLDKDIAEDVFQKPAEQPVAVDRLKAWYIPLRIRISNDVYTRNLKISVAYMVVCSLKDILVNTQILDACKAHVDPDNEVDPGDINAQWFTWQTSQSDLNINGGFQYVTTNMPVLYNQCGSTEPAKPTVASNYVDPTVPTIPPTTTTPPEDVEDPDADTLRIPYKPGGSYEQVPANMSWLKYDNDFEIIEDGSIVPVSYLEQPNLGSGRKYYQAGDISPPTTRAYNGLVLNNRITGAAQTKPVETIERGHSTFYVRMKGYAMRYGYKAPVPYILSVAGRTVKRLSQRASMKTVSVGEHPVNLTKWDVLYVVEGGDPYAGDIASSIITTGDPAYYS